MQFLFLQPQTQSRSRTQYYFILIQLQLEKRNVFIISIAYFWQKRKARRDGIEVCNFFYKLFFLLKLLLLKVKILIKW